MDRIVYCKYFDEEREGLEGKPFPNELGQEIYDNISEDAWQEWLEMQIKIINEYKLDLGERKDKDQLVSQMRAFLKLDASGAHMLEVGTPTEL